MAPDLTKVLLFQLDMCDNLMDSQGNKIPDVSGMGERREGNLTEVTDLSDNC